MQDGLSSTHRAAPGAPWARGQCMGTLRLPHNSAAESGVLPLLPEQQHSEKPSSLIRLMQVRAGGWYRLPRRAPAGGQRAELSEAGRLLLGFLEGGYGSVSPPWEEGPCSLLYPCPQAQIFWGDTPPRSGHSPGHGDLTGPSAQGRWGSPRPRRGSSAGQVWPGRPAGSHPAAVLVPLTSATNREFFQEAPLPKAQCPPAAPLPGPSTQRERGTSSAGAAAAEGRGARDRRERRERGPCPPLLTAPDPVAFSRL